MSAKKRKSKTKKSRSSQKTPHFPRVNSWQLGHPHSKRNIFQEKEPKSKPKRESQVDVLGWKARYETERKEKQKLNKRIKQYQSQIKALQISLGKSASKHAKSMKNVKNTDSINKKLKQIQKELRIHKRKLKLAQIDMQKTADYYQKQIEKFKTKQNKLLKKNKALNNSKKSTKKGNQTNSEQMIKYVFVEDIKKVTLRGKGKKAGIRVNFADGEEAVFNNIEVAIPKSAETDYSDVLKEVKDDDTLLMEEKDSDMSQSDYESIQMILTRELQKRIEDIEKLSQIIFEQKYIFNEVVDEENHSLQIRTNMVQCIGEIETRHGQYALDFGEVYEKIKKCAEIEESEVKMNEESLNVIDEFDKNNGLWRDLLVCLPMDVMGILGYELNDRIDDLGNIKDVLFRNESALYDTIDAVIVDIGARHKHAFEQWNTAKDNEMMEKWETMVSEVNLNNTRWREQIQMDVSLLQNNHNIVHVTDSEDTSDEIETKDAEIIDEFVYVTDDTQENNIRIEEKVDESEMESENESSEHKEEVISDNWLFTDSIRNQFLESLKVNQHSVQLLNYIGQYLNLIIPTSDELQPRELRQLYVPIILETNNPRNIIMACLDGVLFAVLVNLVEPDFIDLRALHLPHSQNPIPLTDLEISENIRTIFASLRALDLQLPLWTIEDYFVNINTVNIILSIVFQLFRGMLDAQINLTTHPELIRLCDNDKDSHEAPNWVWTEWLQKWLLYMKGDGISVAKSESDEKSNGFMQTPTLMTTVSVYNTESDADLIRNILHTTDYHNYLVLICCRIDPNFASEKLPQLQNISSKNSSNSNANDIVSAQLLLECIKNVIGVNTIIKAEDISSHNPILQEILLSDIFVVNNTLEKMNATEVKRLTSTVMHITTKKERAVMAWINKFSPTKLHITNLEDALMDGIIILQILDKLKPGSVNWKSVRQKDEIRHKFDRLTNCKMVMEVSRHKFSFSLVGMGGNDIADGNLKYIHTLLWQIMRYDSTRLLSELQFNGKSVTDKMMLQWANHRVETYKKYISANNNDMMANIKVKSGPIKSFRDRQLSDSIFFLNLLSSIHKDWINYDLIFEVQSIPTASLTKRASANSFNNALSNTQSVYVRERLLNAKYLVTTIRKFGGEIFVLPCDICNTDSKALASIFASIMTIAVKHSDDDESKIENSSQLR